MSQNFNFPYKGSRILDEFKRQRDIERAQRAIMKRAAVGHGFAGSAINRLTHSLTQYSAGINSDLDGSLVILRSRARDLAANNEFGRRYLSLCAMNIIGHCGPKLEVRAYTTPADPAKAVLDKAANDAVEIHCQRWARRADITGRMSLAHLYRVAIKACARDGESLIRIIRDRALPYGMALQLLESDRLAERMNMRLSNGNIIRQGVELDSRGKASAYWIASTHPGDTFTSRAPQYERVPADDVIHLFLPERAEQVRGYTWMHAVIIRSAQLHGFKESAVVAARVGASKIAALVRDAETSAASTAADALADAKDSAGNLQIDAEAGDILELPMGYHIENWNPEYPHQNFESFVTECNRGIAAGFDVASHNLTGNMNDVNFSSARIAEGTEREMWKTLQDWFIDAAPMRIFAEWLNIALLRGDIRLEQSGKSLPVERYEKFLNAASFQGRRWQGIQPLDDANTAAKLISLGLASRTGLAAEQGLEFEDIADELAQEKKILEDLGLPGVINLQDTTKKPGASATTPVSADTPPPSADGADPAA